MKKPASEPKSKAQNLSFNVLNIRLHSNSRTGPNAYFEIFEKIADSRTVVQVSIDRFIILRTKFVTEISGQKIIYGKIAGFTKISETNWLNINNLEVESVVIPADHFPNIRETDYIFIPAAHRIAIVKSPQFGLYNAIKFLNESLLKVIGSDEQIDVIIEQSSDIFKEIMEAPIIRSLDIEISYSNADIKHGEYYKWLDDELREAEVGNIKLSIRPDQNNEIKIDNSQLIKGALSVAQSNGSVSATIITPERKRKKIITKFHPEIFRRKIDHPDEKNPSIFAMIMERFRNKSHEGN